MTKQTEIDLEQHAPALSADAQKRESTAMTTVPEQQQKPGSQALQEFRTSFLMMPTESMQQALGEYTERRRAFREWLLEQLIEGLHFGYPPGTQPKYDENGWLKSWNKKKSAYDLIDPKQWKPKPSLYKAGADFVAELMYARDEYEADMAGWEQLGKKSGQFVYACRLFSKLTGELLGEGRGVRCVGDKGGDANNAIKMAKKNAKVDAVMSAFGLADLFVQEVDSDGDDQEQDHEKPQQKTDAPKAQQRSKRITQKELDRVRGWYWAYLIDANGGDAPTPEVGATKWAAFVQDATGAMFNASNLSEWTREHYEAAIAKLREIFPPGEI